MAPAISEESTSRFVDTQSGRIHYNEAGSGHPLILLHGSGPGATGWSNFSSNIAALSVTHHVFAVDMPGWGQSVAVTHEQRDHVTACLHFMDALGLQDAALVGNSMGGMTGIRFAVAHADRLTHLVTMGPSAPGVRLFGFGDGPSEGLKVLQRAYLDPSPDMMRELVEVMTFDSAYASDDLARERSVAAQRRIDHLINFIDGFDKPWPRVAEEELAEIRVPTLLIHGRDERVVHYENSLKLVALIPNARMILINRCGHWVQVEHAAEFNEMVASFVRTRA